MNEEPAGAGLDKGESKFIFSIAEHERERGGRSVFRRYHRRVTTGMFADKIEALLADKGYDADAVR